jgi:hypothetical protein
VGAAIWVEAACLKALRVPAKGVVAGGWVLQLAASFLGVKLRLHCWGLNPERQCSYWSMTATSDWRSQWLDVSLFGTSDITPPGTILLLATLLPYKRD